MILSVLMNFSLLKLPRKSVFLLILIISCIWSTDSQKRVCYSFTTFCLVHCFICWLTSFGLFLMHAHKVMIYLLFVAKYPVVNIPWIVLLATDHQRTLVRFIGMIFKLQKVEKFLYKSRRIQRPKLDRTYLHNYATLTTKQTPQKGSTVPSDKETLTNALPQRTTWRICWISSF